MNLMLRAFLVLIALLASAITAVPSSAATSRPSVADAGPIHVLGKERRGPRLVTYTVSTPSLQMSSTVPLKVHVLLPTGYRDHKHRRYPVLYAFPGTSNKASVWLSNIHTEKMTEKLKMIVVIPDGTYNADGGGFYTDWVDQTTSRGVANWETFHTGELVSWIDGMYRTRAARSGRAVVGISQGGFGSMSYAARHPDLYGAVASFSGAVDIYEGLQCRLGATALIGAIMTGLNGVQPNAPFGDPVTDAANWQAHDPGSIVANLDDTRIDLYTSAGVPGETDLGDPAVPGTAGMEAVLHQSNLCFKSAADASGVAYHWHDYLVGTHAWQYGDRALADYLPRLMRFFRTGR